MARSTTRKTSTKAASAGTTTTRSKAVSTRTKAASTRSKAAPAKKATPNTRKAPAAKPVAEAVPAPTVNAPEGGMQPFTSSVTLRKTEFIERVVEATGMKRKDIKPVVEVALKELGNALVKGEDLQLMPMGKVKIHKRKSDGGDDVMLLKFRRGAGSVGAADPLADEEE